MRWIHLSDLHIGRTHEVPQKSVINSLVKQIESVLPLDSKPVDAIFITGDIANSGLKIEYEQFVTIIMDKLKIIPACKNAKTYCAPGNHDLFCDTTPTTWEGIGRDGRDKFLLESTEGIKIRRRRSDDFTAYSEFQLANNVNGPNPLKEVSATFVHDSPVGPIDIITTNTAIFSNKEKEFNDFKKIPATTVSLRTVLDTLDPLARKLILGHHPIDWFIPAHIEPFRTLLVNNNAIYFHGHTHLPTVSHNHNGLESVGFGSAYHTTPESMVPYHNCFALCELSGDDLHVGFHQWDCNNGCWTQLTGLPPAFKEKSELLDGYKLSISHNIGKSVSQGLPTHHRSSPTISRVIAPSELTENAWRTLLVRLHIINESINSSANFHTIMSTAVSTVFSYQTGTSRHYVECLPGRAHLLPKSHIESSNNLIDYEELESYTIVTFGDTDADARNAFLRLSKTKPLKLVTAKDLALNPGSLLSLLQESHLETLDAATACVELFLDDTSVVLIVKDTKSSAWFYLVGEDGDVLDESDPVSGKIRETEHDLGKIPYVTSQRLIKPLPCLQVEKPTELKIKGYLNACEVEFNSVRYAALAAFGFKFKKISLSELYIEPDADVDTKSRSTESLNNAIANALDEMKLDLPLRMQLEAQMRHDYNTEKKLESGTARSLYKQFGSVLVLGDPGSGKTCFVQNEMLAYCKKYGDQDSWYRKHLPIFIPLAEAAKQVDFENMFVVACRFATKRGLNITESQLLDYFSNGEVAFFFDGLDEVVSIDQRSALARVISDLISSGQSKGNRFVLTSRPAAAQVVDIPEDLHVIHLRGLTEEQMRSLAKRVLEIRFSEGGDGLQIEVEQLESKENAMIEQLLLDCKNTPGIGRLAQNPLLLTLLILIYANSGRPATKRHRIYAQAVETLVSVRAHHTGQKKFSESDLRRRLGAAALAVFSNETASVAKMEEFTAALKSIMSADDSAEVSNEEVNQFIQDVAEATGLLVIHGGDSPADPVNVTFMHYSFLEYYAAVGLHSQGDYIAKLPILARQPRWKEVISLLTGIIGDHNDITPVVTALISSTLRSESITLDMLLFAIDCAQESDVPPEACQKLLLNAIERSITEGPALVDTDLRRMLAGRLVSIVESTGTQGVYGLIRKGMLATDPIVSAAFIDIYSHLTVKGLSDCALTDLFNQVCDRGETGIMIVACEAAGRSEILRTQSFVNLLKKAFKRNAPSRFAAVRALEVAPGLADSVWNELVRALDDSRFYIASAAANAILKLGFKWDETRSSHTPVLKAMKCVQKNNSIGRIVDFPMPVPKEVVSRLLTSTDEQDRLMGISLLPWTKNEELFVLTVTIDILKSSKDIAELVAALSSLRLATATHSILKLADVDLILSFLDSEYRNLRIEAVRLAGAIGSKVTTDYVSPRITQFVTGCQKGEYHYGIRALLETSRNSVVVRDFILNELNQYLVLSSSRSDDHRKVIIDLLRTCQELESAIAPKKLRDKLQRIGRDFKEVKNIRHEALPALANIGTFDNDLFNYFIGLLGSPPPGLGNSVSRAISLLLKRARRRLESMRSLYPRIEELESAILNHIDLVNARPVKPAESRIKSLRIAVEDAQHILRSYSEFANRTTVL